MEHIELNGFANYIAPMTCVISVETFPDGSYGNIRIVTGNETYINSMEYYKKLNLSENGNFNIKFIPDSPYERYIPKDKNFEDYCYRSAVLGQILHSYICPENFNFWIHLTLLPLKSDKENIHYCIYVQEATKEADAALMSNISPDISQSVLKTCIKLNKTEDFRKTMDEVIKDIRAICGAEHCCLLLVDDNTRSCKVLGEAFNKENEKLKPMEEYITDEFYDIAASWEETIAGSTCFIAQSREDILNISQVNPRWGESLKSTSAQSMILFPLKSNGQTMGYIWITNFNVDEAVKIKETLELATYFISASISNYQLVMRLETLSSIDLLTGLYNRNAMNSRVEAISSGQAEDVKSISIVFADLNGLKRVNDYDGHFAGDMLLKNAAIVLQKCFVGCEIYRAGGDEFMVIAVNMSDIELGNRLKTFRKNTSDPNGISFAVGCSGCKDVKDIREAMHDADERMYEDKKIFYQLHPEKRR